MCYNTYTITDFNKYEIRIYLDSNDKSRTIWIDVHDFCTAILRTIDTIEIRILDDASDYTWDKKINGRPVIGLSVALNMLKSLSGSGHQHISVFFGIWKDDLIKQLEDLSKRLHEQLLTPEQMADRSASDSKNSDDSFEKYLDVVVSTLQVIFWYHEFKEDLQEYVIYANTAFAAPKIGKLTVQLSDRLKEGKALLLIQKEHLDTYANVHTANFPDERVPTLNELLTPILRVLKAEQLRTFTRKCHASVKIKLVDDWTKERMTRFLRILHKSFDLIESETQNISEIRLTAKGREMLPEIEAYLHNGNYGSFVEIKNL